MSFDPDGEAQHASADAVGLDDYYCITVTRTGALGLEEDDGNLALHAIVRENVEMVLELVLRSLGPGDKAQITLTRGMQHG